MEYGNQTFMKDFILLGFSKELNTRILLFIVFLFMYIFTLFGNISLILTVLASPNLHNPMYYYLCNLSLLDLCFTSVNVPKFLKDLISIEQRISYTGCMIQMYAGLFLGETEGILLAVMAYDRYAAICHPLRYRVIMSLKTCKKLTFSVWLVSLLLVVPSSILKPIKFCTENKINHVVCEILAVLKLSCEETSFYNSAFPIASLFTLLTPFIFILASYICIMSSIIKIHSASSNSKVFSTCASHLATVAMFYGTSMSMYMGQKNIKSSITLKTSNHEKFISVIYGVVAPLLNPIIYSLRNNEVKEAVRKIVVRHTVWQIK